jgi:hypothetical protein
MFRDFMIPGSVLMTFKEVAILQEVFAACLKLKMRDVTIKMKKRRTVF